VGGVAAGWAMDEGFCSVRLPDRSSAPDGGIVVRIVPA
jgi:hypothetical protein